MILRNPESLQLIGCGALPLVRMDLLDKRTIFSCVVQTIMHWGPARHPVK